MGLLHELCRSDAQLSTFRRNLRNALDKLVDVGFLATYEIVNDRVHLTKVGKPSLSVVGKEKRTLR